MAENYNTGVRRIFYRAAGFAEGRVITMDVLSPSLTWKYGLEFTEAGGGLYYYDFNFSMEGTYAALLYENGKKVTSQNFQVRDELGTRITNSTPGPSVINS